MNTLTQNWTIGMDLGDKSNQICILDNDGSVIKECKINNTKTQLSHFFSNLQISTVVIEAGSHSPWISCDLKKMGHEVLVANPRKLGAIWMSNNKSDIRDAEMLARLGRFDRKLLSPINHRGYDAQVNLGIIKSRDILVKTRNSLIAHVRSTVKIFGARISSCSTLSFHKKASVELPDFLGDALLPIIETIEDMNDKIKAYEKEIETICEQYPETERVRQIAGVGGLTALAFILTIDDPTRFEKSRDIGPFLGLVPKRDQSGDSDKSLSITKAGNNHLRRLLVGSANYILGPFGPDCDLRRFGKKFGESDSARKKAKVAVARKLGVLMHQLWVSGEDYDPDYKNRKKKKIAA